MILPIIAAFFATITFAVMFNTNRTQLLYCGLAGGAGWWAYLLISDMTGSAVFGSFIATLIISILANILAVVRKAPLTVFQIPGIIPIVPGNGMYNTLYAVVSNDYEGVVIHLIETLQIAGAIAIGMMLIHTIKMLLAPKRN